MKLSELLKLLNKNGVKLVQHGKRHDIYFSPITAKAFLFPGTPKRLRSALLKAF